VSVGEVEVARILDTRSWRTLNVLCLVKNKLSLFKEVVNSVWCCLRVLSPSLINHIHPVLNLLTLQLYSILHEVNSL